MTGLRVAVMGGSLGGLNAALWLRDIGCDVEVYERSPIPLSGLGAGIVLNPATVRYFTDNGLPDVVEASVRSRWVRYMGRDGQTVTQQPANHLFSSYNALYRGFLDSFSEDRYHLGVAIEAFEQDEREVALHLSGGGEERCDLLVCADGIRSTARSQLLPEAALRYAGYVAWRGTVEEGDLDAETYAALRESITYHVMDHSHMLAYPIPMVDRPTEPGRPHVNWLWYCNVPEGSDLDDLMTDKDGQRREVSLHPGIVQNRHIEKLRKDAASILPPPLAEAIMNTAEPFVQSILDAEVSRMAFGRVALIGDAAFAVRPHAAIGSAKAAEDGFTLAQAVGRTSDDIPAALEEWEPGQLTLGRQVLARAREAGGISQFEGAWEVGSPLPFGLYKVGDSEMAV